MPTFRRSKADVLPSASLGHFSGVSQAKSGKKDAVGDYDPSTLGDVVMLAGVVLCRSMGVMASDVVMIGFGSNQSGMVRGC